MMRPVSVRASELKRGEVFEHPVFGRHKVRAVRVSGGEVFVQTDAWELSFSAAAVVRVLR